MTTKEIIKSWCNELLAPSDADVLVTIHDGRNAVLLSSEQWSATDTVQLESNSLLKAILKKQKEFAKESGVDSLGLSNYVLEFELNNKTYSTPLFIVSAEVRYDRIRDTYQLQQVDDMLINPYLAKLLGMNDQLSTLDAVGEELTAIGLTHTIHEGVYLANFHPHRFVLLKEMELLLSNETLPNSISQLLGDEQTSAVPKSKLHEGTLFSFNDDQAAIFDGIKEEHCVIQGPPGTGKSQVIANLIGKALGNNLKTLVIAEKPVALEVIYNKLYDVGLHHFCLMHHHQLKSKAFVYSLKDTWHFLEAAEPKNRTYHQHADLLHKGLDLTLKRLQQKDLIGGIDFSTFKQLTDKIDLKNTFYSSEVPSIPAWQKDYHLLAALEEKGFPVFGAWRTLKIQPQRAETRVIDQLISRSATLLSDLGLECHSFAEFKQHQRLAAAAHLFFYDDSPIQEDLLTKKRVQNKFFKLYNTYTENLEKEQLLLDEKKRWKDDFTLSQLTEYITILAKNDRFSLRFWKTKKELARLSTLTLTDAKIALQRLLDLKHLQEDLIRNHSELRELGLDTSVQSLEQIKLLLHKLSTLDANISKQLLSKTIKERFELKNNSSPLQEISNLFATHFDFEDETILKTYLEKLSKEVNFLVSHAKELASLSNLTRKVLFHADTLAQAERIVYHSHWVNFQANFPELASLNGLTFFERIERIRKTQQTEKKEFALYIESEILKRFDELHKLLQVPAAKLSEKDKALKKQLRKGKSILVKEFGKSRNHMSPLELLSSEAALWIDVLKPIILGSPYSVAKSIPFKTNLFDLVIFDEASQIPLPHSLGGIARSKKVVVAGDEQQMAPNFYFKKGITTSADLLHQVSYYWRNYYLKHHYRSVHPDLISFSNRYFYENHLLAYPKYGAEKPLKLITIKGIYSERVNEKEAEKAAQLIEEKVKNNEFNFGVVAFSQTQLEAIRNALSPKTQQLLIDNESNDLFFKSLENVQGDECDHLIISLGYGYNPEGLFSMQFGPLNKSNGYRRLNVLMSRARIGIVFLRSVESTDFAISENEGVELLRKLMLHLEQINGNNQPLTFPYGLNYEQQKEELTVLAPHKYIQSSLALVNVHEVLIDRGWKMHYKL